MVFGPPFFQMAQIKVRIAHAPEELESTYFFFDFHGYAVPATIEESGVLSHSRWGYVNANGYAQMFNPSKPPSKYPTPERVIVVLDTLSNPKTKTDLLRSAGVF